MEERNRACDLTPGEIPECSSISHIDRSQRAVGLIYTSILKKSWSLSIF